jgi:hypothetical protein
MIDLPHDRDEQPITQAKPALDTPSGSMVIEDAASPASRRGSNERELLAARQRRYLVSLFTRTDVDILRSDEMWR